MKPPVLPARLVLTAATLGLLTTAAPSQDAKNEPPAAPTHLTVLFEWIEVEQADLHDLTGVRRLPLGGPEIRTEVARLIAAGKATVIESIISHAVDGERTTAESIEEHIYPTEFDPPDTNITGEGVAPAAPAAFETRNVGFSVEFEPALLPGDRFADLALMAEHVQFRGNRMWGQAESESPMPDFYTIRSVQKIRLQTGKPRLLATHRLAESVVPGRKDPRVLVFARADVHAGAGHTEEEVPPKDELPFVIENGELAFLFETFETDQRRLNALLFEENLSTRGPDLREALLADAAAGKADLVDTRFVAGRSGEEAKLISGLEVIYPTEFDPPEISRNGARILPSIPAAFETRITGQTIELKPERLHENIFSLSTSPEVVALTGFIEHGKKEAQSILPHFHAQKVTTRAPFKTGEDSLLGTFRPPAPSDPKRKDPVRILFVRGELIDVEKGNEEDKAEAE